MSSKRTDSASISSGQTTSEYRDGQTAASQLGSLESSLLYEFMEILRILKLQDMSSDHIKGFEIACFNGYTVKVTCCGMREPIDSVYGEDVCCGVFVLKWYGCESCAKK